MLDTFSRCNSRNLSNTTRPPLLMSTFTHVYISSLLPLLSLSTHPQCIKTDVPGANHVMGSEGDRGLTWSSMSRMSRVTTTWTTFPRLESWNSLATWPPGKQEKTSLKNSWCSSYTRAQRTGPHWTVIREGKIKMKGFQMYEKLLNERAESAFLCHDFWLTPQIVTRTLNQCLCF